MRWYKIREKEADYILAVKENQKTLYTNIKEYFEGMESGDFRADEFLKYIRGHWSIENQLRWMLDIVFREDGCRVRTGNAALDLNILRKLALYKLRKMPVERKRASAKRRMMYATLKEDFLYQALFIE